MRLVKVNFAAANIIATSCRTGIEEIMIRACDFKKGDVVIPDDVIEYIVSTPGMTRSEDGVRNLKRCLEIVHTKLNLFRLVKSDSNILTKEIDLKVTFPFTVSKKDVDVLIKNDEKQSQSLLSMYS